MRGIVKSSIDLSHKTGLVKAFLELTVANRLKEMVLGEIDLLYKEWSMTIDLAEKLCKRYRCKKIGDAKALDVRDFELVYVGDDPKILEKERAWREEEFNKIWSKFQQAEAVTR
jgi:hypothetical protein